jgi:cytoskeletal protein CcmA (bactofilin family)
MAALDFPASPAFGQVHAIADITWVWDGEKWVSGHAGGTLSAYLPLSGGVLTGPLSAPEYRLTNGGAKFALATNYYHAICDFDGGGAIFLGGGHTGQSSIYRAATHYIQSKDATATFATFDVAGLTVFAPMVSVTEQYKLAGVRFATRGIDGEPAHVVYDWDGGISFLLYGSGRGFINYYRAEQHVFTNKAGDRVFTTLNSSGNLILGGAITATSITASGTITGALLASTGGVSAAGNINAAGTVQAQQLTSNGNINAAGNVVTVNLNASSTVNANTVAATGTVSGNLLTGNSVSSNTTVNGAQYNLRGAPFATLDAGALVTQLSDPQYINISMYTSGTNYYDNSQHVFRSRAAAYGGGTTYAIFNAGGSYNQTGGWGVISDDTVKTNVAPYTAGLAQVKQLNPVSFEYTPAALMRAAGETNYGLMASEVQPVVPEMVSEAELEIDGVPNPVQTLLPTHLIYLLVNAVKELSARVEQLEAGTPS